MADVRFVAAAGAVVLHDPVVTVVGYSGRDRAAVDEHIAELAGLGVAPPAQVPMVWEFDSGLLTLNGEVRARSSGTSGEVEPVLIFASGEVFVTVGSDHTDRELERASIVDAKRACLKAAAPRCWPIATVAKEWDSLVLESQILTGAGWQDYQRATVGSILPLDWYVAKFGEGSDRVVFCGTVPVSGGLVTDAEAFRGRLVDPRRGDELVCEYKVVDG